MGKLLSGIMGPVSGRVGNLVFTKWKGLDIVKTRPQRTAERTESEKKCNTAFGYTQKWLAPIAGHLNAGLQNLEGFSSTHSGRNIATKFIYPAAIVGDSNNPQIDPSRVIISAGPLPLAEDFQVHFDTVKAEVKVTWNPEVPAGTPGEELSSPDDQLMLLIYNYEEKQVFGKIHGALREAGEQTCILDSSFRVEYHIWVAFTAENRQIRSNSRYLGSVIIE